MYISNYFFFEIFERVNNKLILYIYYILFIIYILKNTENRI